VEELKRRGNIKPGGWKGKEWNKGINWSAEKGEKERDEYAGEVS
jgi:hypothetical protein